MPSHTAPLRELTSELPLTPADIIKEQRQSQAIQTVIAKVMNPSMHINEDIQTNELKKLIRNIKRLTIRDDMLQRMYYNEVGEITSYQPVLPMKFAMTLCKELHDGRQHQGVAKCIQEYRKSFYVPGITESIYNYARNCAICIQTKPAKQEQIRPPLQEIMANTNAPEEIMQIDLVGKMPVTTAGHTHILTAIDVYSRYLFAIPLRNA